MTDLDGIVWLVGMALLALIVLGTVLAFLALAIVLLRGASRSARERPGPGDRPEP